MGQYDIESDEKKKKKAWTISFCVHVGIILLALLPWFKFQDPPPEKEGILVSFGAPNMGSGQSRPKTQNIEKVEPKPPSEVEKVEEVIEESTPPPPEPTPPTQTVPEEVVTADNSEEIAIQKKKEQEELERREKAEAEAEAKRIAAEAEAKKKAAEEEAKKKAAEEAARKEAEYEKSKDQFGDLFGGSGKGSTDKPGNQGDPNGDPDASNLEGISSGSGRIGGGLGGRGLLYEPQVTDNSQKTGKVVMKVCVGKDGKVVSADFTQRGSTTTDAKLIDVARKASLKYKFSASSVTKQCGTITFDFKLR